MSFPFSRKNRALQLQFVKVDKSDQPEGTPSTESNPFLGVNVAAAYSEVAKDFITHTALTVGGVWAICKVIGKLCK